MGGIIASMKGWKTISGLASLIVALLFKDGTLGDGGMVAQIVQYFMTLLGGGLTVGGVIDKIKREAAEKAAEAARLATEKAAAAVKEKTGSNMASEVVGGILAGIIDAAMTHDFGGKNSNTIPPKVLAAARALAQENIKGYTPSGYGLGLVVEPCPAQQAAEKMAGYTPAGAERKTREPANADMVAAAMNTNINTETAESVTTGETQKE